VIPLSKPFKSAGVPLNGLSSLSFISRGNVIGIVACRGCTYGGVLGGGLGGGGADGGCTSRYGRARLRELACRGGGLDGISAGSRTLTLLIGRRFSSSESSPFT